MNHIEGGDGFTLLEMLIVVALIGLLAGFFLSFPSTTPGALRHSGRVIAAELGYAAQRAISTGRPHRWLVNLDEQSFRIEEQVRKEEPRATELPTHAELLDLSPPSSLREYAPVENRSGEWRWLDDTDVAIDEVLIGDDSYAEGQAGVAFSPDGGADPAEVWLRDEAGREMRARVVAFTGEIHLEDALRE